VQSRRQKPKFPKETPISFIENKSIDVSLLREILRTSRNQNHWANFGPAVELLEEAIHRALELPSNRRVVSCKSATDALMALVGMHEHNAGRKLRWVVSAFGFFSTRLGPLAQAKVLDCDHNGVISLTDLKNLDPGKWDGVVVTNPFSLAENTSTIIEFAQSMGKKVIVDNAAAMFSRERHHSGYPDEIISFHQTKPWGMGEGGCAIVNDETAATIRSLTNFGVGLSDSAARYAQNSKMSDFDAALILQRLVNLPNWQSLYRLQKRRIMSVASPLGLELLKPAPPEFLSAHVPLLSSRTVDKDELVNPYLTLRKYYKPLATGFQNAQRTYDRIVCVPCHPGVANCSTKDLGQLLERFTK
jgi:dTDP-4-amino-4,6-dideoxygalactose transaminase